MRRGRLLTGVGLAVVAAAFASVALAGNLGRNPANKPKLIDEPIESLDYDPASRCKRGERPGARSLARWLDTHTRGEFWGIYRCEKWGKGSASVHSEGRAIDWRLDAGRPKEKRAAMHLIKVLIEPDRNGEPFALARRMGVQGLIFNCKSWYGGELGPYSRCYKPNGKPDDDVDRTTAHKDHVHLELNWAGARKKTSFWKSKYAPRGADRLSPGRRAVAREPGLAP